MQKLIDLLDRALADEPPLTITEGGMIRDGYNVELDELRQIAGGGKDFLIHYQIEEQKRTGISSLKIKFNNVFGYFIEVPRSQIEHVPADYQVKQTLVNAGRFITPRLKEYEEKVLGAEEKIKELEYKLFLELRENVMAEIAQIQQTAETIAVLDVLTGFAEVAHKHRFTRPRFTAENKLKILNGRHPVVENLTKDFVPNDLQMYESQRFILLTGPNMAGKSTYLRQNALIILLAQMGSFVPAESVEMSPVDQIFCRVGASDNLSEGQSTFMVEMQETAYILNNATEKSFVILDEVGRGTSTYDGVSIAWAISEYLHTQLKSKTIFATHYHELNDLIKSLESAENFSMAVIENPEGVIFLHKVIKGGVDKSYGIEVAKLAGLPKEIIKRAEEVLAKLEKEELGKIAQKAEQMGIFGETQIVEKIISKPSLIEEEIREMNINVLTPLDALQKIDEWKKNL